MAETLATKAREALSRGDFREAALFARNAVENAAKAILCCFTTVPRSHEPADLLVRALGFAEFPQPLREWAAALVEPWRSYGMQEHVLLSYGDEQARVDPWSLVGAEHAREVLAAADEACRLATRCREELFGGG
jgi:HEPN domain-containing protein